MIYPFSNASFLLLETQNSSQEEGWLEFYFSEKQEYILKKVKTLTVQGHFNELSPGAKITAIILKQENKFPQLLVIRAL